MKHIFFVNSSITYLISLSIINSKKINVNDVLILSGNFNSKYLPIRPTSLFKANAQWNIRSPFVNKVKLIDEFITNYVGLDGYHLYIQHAIDRQKIFMTHPLCKNISFIEEGFSNYFTNDTLLQFSANKRNLPWRLNFFQMISQIKKDIIDTLNGFSSKMRDLPAWAPAYFNLRDVCYYCISNQAFPGVPIEKKKIIDLKILFKNFFYDSDIPSFHNETIWIGDNLVKGYKIPVSEYIEGIRDFLNVYLKNSRNHPKNIILKFHQSESKLLRSKVIQLVNELGLSYIVLEDGIPIEMILLRSSNCQLLGIMSSLLYYSSFMGHEVYSGINYLPMQNKFSFDMLNIEKNTIKFLST